MMFLMKRLEVLSHCGRKDDNLPPTGMLLSLTFEGIIQGPEEYPAPSLAPLRGSLVLLVLVSTSLGLWDSMKILLGDRFFLEGKAFFLPAVLHKTASRSGPKRKSPEKGIPHNLILDVKSPVQVFSQIG